MEPTGVDVDELIEFCTVLDEDRALLAGQLGVDASDLGFYEWAGRTIEYHRAQIRDHLG